MFASFVGGLAYWGVLLVYWQRRKHHIYNHIEHQKIKEDIPLKSLFSELLSYSGPFVLVVLVTSLYQFVDLFTFQGAMTAVGLEEIWIITYSIINVLSEMFIIVCVTIDVG